MSDAATPPYASAAHTSRGRSFALTELLVTALGFTVVYGVYLRFFDDGLPLRATWIGCAASALAFWLAGQLKDGAAEDDDSVFFIERLCFSTGISLLVHAFVTYGLFARRTPFLVVGSCLVAAVATAVLRRWRGGDREPETRILFIGFDDLCQRLAAAMRQPVAGIWGTCAAAAPDGVVVQGTGTDFLETVAALRPTHIVVGLPSCEALIPAETLLRCRLEGIRITDAAALYERLFSRVCCERLQPAELALSSGLKGDSRTMAIQAVYNNVVGLAILLAVAPLMLMSAGDLAALAAVALGLLGAFYIVLGYPLLLAFLRSRKAPAIRKDLNYRTTVSAVMAVHNGASQIAAKLDTLCALEYPPELFEIVVVSDGSTDATADIVRRHAAASHGGPRIVLIEGPRAGKAAALNLALERAQGEILFFTDVRQPLEPDALRHLVANFADPAVGAVTGEMLLRRGDTGEQADMDLYWRYEIRARSRHSEIDSLFNTTGCIYALRRALAGPIPADTLTDDAVLPQRAFFAGYRVIFDREAKAWDSPAVAGTEFRRRFRTLAGLCQVFAREPRLFTGSNRMRWHFLSHKFGRLALPWTLLLTFGATLLLSPSTLRTALLSVELTPVGLALLNGLVPRGFVLKRLCSPARTFLVMNLAALAAPAVFVLPVEKI